MQKRSIHLIAVTTAMLAVCLSVPCSAFAQGYAAPDSTAQGDESLGSPFEGVGATGQVFHAPGVTGDWGGARQSLADNGVQLSLDVTSTFQGVENGGFDEGWKFMGSSELIVDLDSQRLGLWRGGYLRLAAEGRWGNNVVGRAGTLSPVNTDALLPADADHFDDDVFAPTEVTVTQYLTSNFGLFGGLLNNTSVDANDFAGFARRNDLFWNLAFLRSPVTLRLVPTVTLGGGLIFAPADGVVGSLTVMNTEESAASDPFDTNDGVTVMTEWAFEYEIDRFPVRHLIAFGYGFDNDFYDLGDQVGLIIPPGGPAGPLSSDDETWAAWYNGQLDFWTDARDAERRAGVFWRFGYADDETNPVEWSLAAGATGLNPSDFRPGDRFGAGIYHIEPSSEFALSDLGVQEETGFEAFYTFQVVPNVDVTADLQRIRTGLGDGPLVGSGSSNSWTVGLRLNVVL